MTRPASCQSCGAAVLWATTSSGRLMPVDAEPVPSPGTGNVSIEWSAGGVVPVAQVVAPAPGLHKSHFATCPHADSHRRKGTTK